MNLKNFNLAAPLQIEIQKRKNPKGQTNKLNSVHPNAAFDLWQLFEGIVANVQGIKGLGFYLGHGVSLWALSKKPFRLSESANAQSSLDIIW